MAPSPLGLAPPPLGNPGSATALDKIALAITERTDLVGLSEKGRNVWGQLPFKPYGETWEHDPIAYDLFNIHVVTEFFRDVIISTYK